MNYYVDIQHECSDSVPVSDETLTNWVTLSLKSHREKAELTLRFVDAPEMIELNHAYRKQNKVTNVLAFPATLPKDIELDFPLLGDIIICPSVLRDESQSLHIGLNAHWAHIVIHGVLHLLGYDHINDSDTEIMQRLEISLLSTLGFANPYQTEEDTLE